MGRNRQLAKNVSFVTVGNMGAKLIGFFMLPLYTRWLSPEDYGTADMISVFAMLLLNVVACDVSDAIFVFPSGESEERIKRFYSTGFFFQAACSLLCALLFFFLSRLPYDYIFFSHIWLVYGVLISGLFQKYAQDFCRGINKMSVFSLTGIVQSLFVAGFSFLLIPSRGVYGYVSALILSNVITAAFSFVYSKSYRYLSFRGFGLVELREMLRYSVPLIPTAVLWWLVSSLNRPLLEQYVGIFAIGLLAVAGKLPGVMSLVFNFFQQAWIVTVMEEYKKPDFDRYYNKMFRMIVSVQVMACLLVIMFSKTFIDWMTSEEFYEAWKYIPLLAISVIFSNASAFIGTIFAATRESKYTFYSVIVGGAAAVLFNFLLIPCWGVYGACAAICLAHALTVVSRARYSRGLVRFSGKAYLAGEVMVLAAAYLSALLLEKWWLVPAYGSCMALYLYLNRQTLQDVKAFVSGKAKMNKRWTKDEQKMDR